MTKFGCSGLHCILEVDLVRPLRQEVVEDGKDVLRRERVWRRKRRLGDGHGRVVRAVVRLRRVVMKHMRGDLLELTKARRYYKPCL